MDLVQAIGGALQQNASSQYKHEQEALSHTQHLAVSINIKFSPGQFCQKLQIWGFYKFLSGDSGNFVAGPIDAVSMADAWCSTTQGAC